MKKLFLLLSIALSGYSCLAQAQTSWPDELILTPEKTDFTNTSTYTDVQKFITAISEKTSHAHLISMGRSPEGKDIPVVVLARPLVKTPEEAKASGKPVIYIQGNIHAGEVEGKEVVMMLMRDILLGNKKHLLENQIILFAPIYNTDSNDKMEKGRRLSQEDSPLEVGIRENSQGLDLNRDGIKMEANETYGLFNNIVTKWDPQLFVDLHTTNGTWHAYSLTYAPSYHYAGEFDTHDYTLNHILKTVDGKVRALYDLDIAPFGDYHLSEGWPPKNFYTYNHHPRYLVNQFSLRNRMAILSEAFAHERFYQRIHATYAFVNEILEYTNRNAKTIQSINKSAEAKTIKNVIEKAGKIKKGVRFKMVPLETISNFPTYDYLTYTKADGTQGYYRTGRIVKYDSVVYHAKFIPEIESTLPRGYVIPAEFADVVENLKAHGIKVTVLAGRKQFEGETFVVEKLENASRKFEGHFMASVSGKFKPSKKTYKKGDFFVDLAQPLANLAFYLLEPQSDDGLLTWNFFDHYFKQNNVNNKPVDYPVFKYYK